MLRKSYAIHVTNLSASLQCSEGRWVWLLGILGLGAFVLGLGDSTLSVLRYDRTGIGAGQWWRLLSAHAVHADVHHFVLNALGLVLVWALFAREYRAFEWCLIVVLSALGIGLGLWQFDPQVQWYVGASGVLHAAMAVGSVKRLVERQWDRWILAVFLMGKLALEQYAQVHGSKPLSGAVPVIVDAHLYGAVTGALIGAALCARLAIIRKISHER